jgi:hypothetical protein
VAQGVCRLVDHVVRTGRSTRSRRRLRRRPPMANRRRHSGGVGRPSIRYQCGRYVAGLVWRCTAT